MGVHRLRIISGCFLITLFFLTGCADKLPRLSPPSVRQQETAEMVLRLYLSRPKIQALDADIRLKWDVLGSSGGVDGLLQVQNTGQLRLTIVDPLGRSLYMLVSDGRTFTLVDSRQGKGYQGEIDSTFSESYIPAAIRKGDFFALIGGLMPGDREQVDEVGVDGKSAVWYGFRSGENEHRILLEGGIPVMAKHLIEDDLHGETISISYSDYFPVDSQGSLWPGMLEVTGDGIHGTLQLEVKKVVSVLPVNEDVFHLAIPPHFSRETVQ